MRLMVRSGALALLVSGAACSTVALASGPAAHSARPVARTAGTCNINGQQRRMGPSYVTSLKVRHTSCATGKRVVRAYYRCRVHSGGVKGRCHSRVLGYRCRERRQGISIQFDAQVTCTRGHRWVYHTYTQNT